MKLTTKILAALALFTSLNASAFVQEYASLEIIPHNALKSFKIDENTSTSEKVRYFISEWRDAYQLKNQDQLNDATKNLVKIAETNNDGLAMFALGYHAFGSQKMKCGYDRECMSKLNPEVLKWWTQADALDSTGQVAGELSGYFLATGPENEPLTLKWAKIAKDKMDN